MGAGLPAMRPSHSTLMLPVSPPSRASSLPQGAASCSISAITLVQCGSGLAREEAVTSSINVAWHTAFASKPAPTGVVVSRPSPASRSLRLPTSSLPANFARSLPIQRPGLRTRVNCTRTSAQITIVGVFLCPHFVQWRLCVGDLRVCRVVQPVSQPAHSCHPFA